MNMPHKSDRIAFHNAVRESDSFIAIVVVNRGDKLSPPFACTIAVKLAISSL